MDVYEQDQLINGLVDTTKSKGSLKEYQTVISVGDTVRGIKEGDVVCIDPTRYMMTKHNDKSLRNGVVGDNITIGYRFNTIKLNDKDCLMLYDQDITFVVEESEDVEEPTVHIIQPEKPGIIV
jgi:co-chaperonin GroES (HSP10)